MRRTHTLRTGEIENNLNLGDDLLLQSGQLTLIAGTLDIDAGIRLTANSKVYLQLVTPGAGVSGSRYKVDTVVLGEPGTASFTVTAVDSLAGDNIVITDVSVIDYTILG